MKKALMYAHVASMIKLFNMDNIRILQKMGYKVDVACNFQFGSSISDEEIEKLKRKFESLNIDYYDMPVPRKLSDLKNLYLSYKKSKDIFNKNNYELVHCHSPIGAIICRIANKHSKNYNHTRMIYTAHGFHFFKGNHPLKNFVFKNVEKYGARYTDTLITINKEDYNAAKKFKLKENGNVEYVPGIGINLTKINSMQGNKESICDELNISHDSTLMLTAGELTVRKNHEIVIKSLNQLDKNIHFLICGQGVLKEHLLNVAKENGVSNRVHLLGYRNNVVEIMKSCDLFVFPSLQEGLPVALMEAMACGLPCVASEIRGNTDLIEDGKNGCLFSLSDGNLIEKINKSYKENIHCEDMSMFSIQHINKEMERIYRLEGK